MEHLVSQGNFWKNRLSVSENIFFNALTRKGIGDFLSSESSLRIPLGLFPFDDFDFLFTQEILASEWQTLKFSPEHLSGGTCWGVLSCFSVLSLWLIPRQSGAVWSGCTSPGPSEFPSCYGFLIIIYFKLHNSIVFFLLESIFYVKF